MPRTTLTIEGLPDGDEANTVTVKYTKPVENSSAWLTDTFTVIDEYVDDGSQPIVSTALDLPGVYRKSEASNKAILKLRRSNNRFRASFVTVDDGIMFQPADVLEINDTNRGISSFYVYVETAVMIGYGRWRITGIRYRDGDYSDECYVEEDNVGKWVDVLGPPVVYVDCLEYACDAYSVAVSVLGPIAHWPYDQGGPTPSLGNNDEIEAVVGPNLTVSDPYSQNDPDYPSFLSNCSGYAWRKQWPGSGDNSNHSWSGVGPTIDSSFTWGYICPSINTASNFNTVLIDIHRSSDNARRLRVQSYTRSGNLYIDATNSGGETLLYTFPTPYDSVYAIHLSWVNVTSPPNSSYIEAYVNHQYVGQVAVAHDIDDTGLYLGQVIVGGTTSHMLHLHINGELITSEEFSALDIAYDRNFTTYVDPNCA